MPPVKGQMFRYSEADMEAAIEECKRGVPIATAAKKFDVPQNMLVRQLQRGLQGFMRHGRAAFHSTEIAPENNENMDLLQAQALDKDLCLLVDGSDNFLGSETKRNCHKVQADGQVPLHRAFSVFLFNKRGDILLQRRSATKVTYPEYYTNACCSHPLLINNKQEDVVTAARRRLHHELGIPLDQLDASLFTYMTRIHYYDPGDGMWGEHEIDYILMLQADLTINPNPEEVSEIAYIPKNEFNSFLPTLVGPLTPWFELIRRHRLKLWWDNLHRLHEIQDHNKIYSF